MKFNSHIKILSFFLITFSFLLSSFAQEDVKKLVDQLGASSHDEREEATKKLWELGPKAIPELDKAAKSDDPEVKDRAQKLLQRIKLGIQPDMAKDAVEKLEKYSNSSKEEKGKMLIELSRDNGGWETIKTLLYLDFDQDLSDIILTQVDSEVILNLRDGGRDKDAAAMMELAAVFTGNEEWVLNYVSYVIEREKFQDAISSIKSHLPKLKDEQFEIKAAIHTTAGYIYRAFEKFEEAAKESQEVYKLAFKNDSEKLKAICKPLFIDTHLLAGKYYYLEKFWEKTSFEFTQEERLLNIFFLQKLQNKDTESKDTLKKLYEEMDNEKEYPTLAERLLLTGEREEAEKLYLKYEDYASLAQLARTDFDYLTYEKWLKKSAEKDDDSKLELLSFIAENTGSKEQKKELIEAFKKREKLTEKVTAALFLMQAGFKTEATPLLKELMNNPELPENDAFRAAWGITENRSLAELFIHLRYKTRSKKINDATDFVALLALTEDAEAFTSYMDLLQEQFEGLGKNMVRIIGALGNFCMEKEWYTNAAAIVNLMQPAQRGIFNAILESEALIRNGDYVKSVHNLLTTPNLPKISLPYFIVAQAYAKAEDPDKQQKALEMARYYDMAREQLLNMTSSYLYENGYYTYFIETTEKLTYIGRSLSPIRIEAFRKLSSSHIHNLKHDKAQKPFMSYYLLSSSTGDLHGPSEANRMAYQFFEFKLRDAVKNDKKEDMAKYAAKCQKIFKNNIEVPILLKESSNKNANALFNDYFSIQWKSLTDGIKKYPNNALLLNTAAWVGALCDHELEKCLVMVQKAIDIEPSAANYDTRAEVEFRLKKFKEALKSIEIAAKMDKLEPFFRERVKKFKSAVKDSK
ncbi:MAG: hypothetical protein NE328_00615 [Lentisphaeraceae bacterium]|nr:hypothetical protein [Lentisphaeraceae bacterium]